uniref:Uncharacterized protein n=1 Tax=viral metagenome TaxID=1070528 RepID=A0A6M3XGI8_9ZZZZ
MKQEYLNQLKNAFEQLAVKYELNKEMTDNEICIFHMASIIKKMLYEHRQLLGHLLSNLQDQKEISEKLLKLFKEDI